MPGNETLILNHLLELRAEVAANSAQIVELRGDFHELKEDVKALQMAPASADGAAPNKRLATARDSAFASGGGLAALALYSGVTKLFALLTS